MIMLKDSVVQEIIQFLEHCERKLKYYLAVICLFVRLFVYFAYFAFVLLGDRSLFFLTLPCVRSVSSLATCGTFESRCFRWVGTASFPNFGHLWY